MNSKRICELCDNKNDSIMETIIDENYLMEQISPLNLKDNHEIYFSDRIKKLHTCGICELLFNCDKIECKCYFIKDINKYICDRCINDFQFSMELTERF